MSEVVQSDEEKYANESFENDEDEIPEISETESDSNNESVPTEPTNNTLYAYARNRYNGRGNDFPNKNYVPYDSSSEDDNDVIVSETIVEINTEPMCLEEVANTPKTATRTPKLTAIRRGSVIKEKLRAHLESKREDFNPKSALSDDDAPELDLLCGKQKEYSKDNNAVEDDENKSNNSIEEQDEDDEDNEDDDDDNEVRNGNEDDNVNDNDNVNNNDNDDDDDNDNDNDDIYYSDGEFEVDADADADEDVDGDADADADAGADLAGVADAITAVRLQPDDAIDPYEEEHREAEMRFRMDQLCCIEGNVPLDKIDMCNDTSHILRACGFLEQGGATCEANILQFARFASNAQKYSSKASAEAGLRNPNFDCPYPDTETDNGFGPNVTEVDTDAEYIPKVEVRFTSQTPTSFNSDEYAFHLNFVKSNTSNDRVRFRGQRKSWSFTNDRMREIERHNQILLRKILSQKPTYTLSPKKPKKKFAELPATTRTSSAAINRKKQQRQIDIDNQGLKRRIEAISLRRPLRKP